MNKKIKIGISSCLLGEKVRYNGEHKLDPYLKNTLGPFVEFVPVCPEVEAGFGVPREPMKLVEDAQASRLVTLNSEQDLTDQMLKWTTERINKMETENLDGFIFKSKSPSCGISDINIYTSNGSVTKEFTGLFARAFMNHFPQIPIENEMHLQNPTLRERFFKRIRLDLY